MNECEPDSIRSNTDVAIQVFGGTASDRLAGAIAENLGIRLGRAKVDRFPDGETIIKLEDDVRGRDCFVVQATCPPVNEHLMELLIYIDSLRRASARRITAVVPYFGYARQDRKAEGRTPITAKLVANLIAQAGAHRMLAMDLHAEQIQGFFDLPVDHLTALAVIAEHVVEMGLSDCVVVSPDGGNLKRATAFARRVGGELAVIDKRRIDGKSTQAARVIGDVDGKTVMLFDDMITTAGTATEAIRILRDRGAKRFLLAATHAVFAGPAVDRICQAGIDWLVVTDTIPISEEVKKRLSQLTILSVAPLLAEALRRIHLDQSISELFQEMGS